jgi:signal transduction histidine kinase
MAEASGAQLTIESGAGGGTLATISFSGAREAPW